MFDRFTDRARKVMALSRQEAQIFNHNYIGTEHLLLGLIQEGSGIAANVLRNFHVDKEKVRREIIDIISVNAFVIGKKTGQRPWTPRAKKSLELASTSAAEFNHNYIGTEHLLLGLIRENEGIAAQVILSNLGVTLKEVEQEVKELLGISVASTKDLSRPSWDDTFLDLCFVIAKRSKDRSTRVGCVIVGPNKEPRAMGYNGIPRGCLDDVEERHARPAKYFYFEHAERNAIYNAARSGTSLDGCSLYIPGPPCADCSRAIIQSGIKEVICASAIAPKRFKESCEASLEMLKEAKIVVRPPNTNWTIEGWSYVDREGWGDERSRPSI